MAEKRSNKTARVLNLITQQRTEEPKETAEEKTEQMSAAADAPKPMESPEEPAVEQTAVPEAPESTDEPTQTEKPVKKKTARSRSAEKKKEEAPRRKAEEQKAETQETKEVPEAAEEPQAVEPAPVSEPTSAQTQTAPPVAAPPPVVVPIVQTAKERERALADEIRFGLMHALETEEEQAAQQAAQTQTVPEPEVPEPTPEGQVPEPMEQELTPEALELENELEKQKKVHFIVKEEMAEQEIATPDGDQRVELVNVLQELVDENEPYYTGMLQCACPRCVMDMKALALSNLPAKYVVMESEQKKIVMRLYATRYEKPLTTQLMKACVIVNENPHH